jgi:ParB/RepB/Spo0J family partition protein
MSEIEQTKVGEVRMVALSRITPRHGFNPRTQRDPERFAQLVASVKADGVLTPLLVTPGDGDELLLVAGEGRWLAAGEAGQTEVPVYVVSVDERTGGLELAMAENLARQDFDPVQEAHGFQRLRDAGLTKKGIADRLGVAAKRVTDRLEILKLPTPLHGQIAGGQIPPAAIRPLVTVGKVHPGLPEVLAARVAAKPTQSWASPLSWGEVIADPIAALVADIDGPGCELPANVFEAGDSYPLDRFDLSDPVRGQLAELLELLGLSESEFVVRFGREAVEQAAAVKAVVASKEGWHHLIVGQDVADQLAGDYIAACLTVQQQAVARQQAYEQTHGTGESAPSSDEIAEAPSEEELAEQRRVDREAEQAQRRAAVAHNAALGAAVLKHLARLKVDSDVLKVLTAVDVGGDLAGIAARGARYGFPGWTTETTQKNGKVKVEYLTKEQAGAKARTFLENADSMAEIAGRLFCLIAMACYADEQAVARSARSFSSLTIGRELPYADRVVDVIDELCAQRLPEHLTQTVREQRREQREIEAEHAEQVSAASERLTQILGGDGPLADEQLAQARADVELVHGRYSTDGYRLLRELDARGATTAAEPTEADADGNQSVAEAA